MCFVNVKDTLQIHLLSYVYRNFVTVLTVLLPLCYYTQAIMLVELWPAMRSADCRPTLPRPKYILGGYLIESLEAHILIGCCISLRV